MTEDTRGKYVLAAMIARATLTLLALAIIFLGLTIRAQQQTINVLVDRVHNIETGGSGGSETNK